MSRKPNSRCRCPRMRLVPSEEIGLIREEAWTDGYLTGRQALSNDQGGQTVAAKLLTSLHDLEATAAQATDMASLGDRRSAGEHGRCGGIGQLVVEPAWPRPDGRRAESSRH